MGHLDYFVVCKQVGRGEHSWHTVSLRYAQCGSDSPGINPRFKAFLVAAALMASDCSAGDLFPSMEIIYASRPATCGVAIDYIEVTPGQHNKWGESSTYCSRDAIRGSRRPHPRGGDINARLLEKPSARTRQLSEEALTAMISTTDP